jgi:protease secretion system membrane fusion protein
MANPPRKLTKENATDASNVIDHTPDLPTDIDRTTRLGIIAIVIGFVGFLTWAAYAPLDEGVPAQATVTIDTKRKTIQHMTGGIVERVAVREGQRVKAGDTLVELNDESARANYESIRQTYMSQRATESRLLAEIDGRPHISFHQDLVAASADPVIGQHIATQNRLFDSRRAALKSELAGMDESIAGQEALIAGLRLQLENRNVQLQKQTEQQKNISELAEAGYVPRNQALQLEQAQAEIKSVLAEMQASKLRTERSIAELKQRRTQRIMESSKESAAQLAEVRREVQAGRERLNALTAELGRIRIKAPVDGQVVGLSLASIGGVVSPGQKLMDIVPAEENVVLEARIPTHIIDRVHAGDSVAARFTAFAHSPQLVADGKISSLSGDVVTEQTPMGNASFYLARVILTPDGMKTLGNRQLQPGMGAEVLIKTGERSLLTYLLQPLTKRLAAAMKEE